MQNKDESTRTLHFGHAPGKSGYLFANHPLTNGPVRGPAQPFVKANKPWAPEEHHPDGPYAQKNAEHAPIGAFLEGSHAQLAESLRKTRSLPALERTLKATFKAEDDRSLGERAKEAANPLSIELNRWQRLANVTKRDLNSMPELHSWKAPERKDLLEKNFLPRGGLVNFPKYTLWERSNLKQMDLQRFNDEIKEMKEAHDRGELQPASPSQDDVLAEATNYQTVSIGAPKLRGPGATKKMYAGSAMPAGRNQRSSNPFRMG
jgi:hypothetical protein